MFRRIVALLLAGCMLADASLALAAEESRRPAPAWSSVNVERQSSENPVQEIARSVLYGALAGLVVGSAISLASDTHTGEPVRWGIVIGTFVGLGAGIYFVTHRPQPASLLELRDGRLVPNAALGAVEPVPGGVEVHAVGLSF